MILDEAHSIKNVNSIRWNTLLEFSCRNRLLLTGTPIQNSMSELWALLHFIMPKLFDSHEQFQEWFSKDIEAHSQEKGELNREQLKRLHTILKPFMLRRIKKDVENEIGPKTEYEISCVMTQKQSLLYNSIKSKLNNISDLFTSVDSKLKVENLMNLVMQFRKVCNHPELFERNIGKIPFVFRDLSVRRSSTYIVTNDDIHYCKPDTTSALSYKLPKLIYDEIINGESKLILKNQNNLTKEVYNQNIFSLLPYNKSELSTIIYADAYISQLCILHCIYKNQLKESFKIENKENSYFKIKTKLFFYYDITTNEKIKDFINISQNYAESVLISEIKTNRFYIPKAIALPIDYYCSSINFKHKSTFVLNNPLISKILYGNSFKTEASVCKIIQKNLDIKVKLNHLAEGALSSTRDFYKGFCQLELPSFERLVSECSKLKTLDNLLIQLHREGHRVLIFCQMTKMIDILEEYMSRRRFSYYRMDGSTNIADRRDMVNGFQNSDEIFTFLLSTRAGGLGVNLTAADTVIFYDNDWNPTMDAQATDRAHRIGQTKPVTVYRLTTKNSIEERILKRAQQKQNVQTTVYSGGAFKADIFKQSEIFELLYSEEEVKKIEEERKKIQAEYSLKMQTQRQQNEDEAEEKRKSKKIRKEEEKNLKIKEKEKEKRTKEIKEIKGKSIFAVKRAQNKDADDDEGKVVIMNDNDNDNFVFDIGDGDDENTDSINNKYNNDKGEESINDMEIDDEE